MDTQQIIVDLINHLPTDYGPYALAAWSIAVTLSNLILMKWRPPALGSKWLLLYKILRLISLSKGYNTPAFQPSSSALMIPVDMPAKTAAEHLGLEPATTDPKYTGAPQYKAISE